MRPLVAALLAEIQGDDAAKRELAGVLRPYLIDADDESSGRLLNVTEKATQLALHPDTLMRMARERRIWATKVGREWRFRSGDLPASHPSAERPRATAAEAPNRRRTAPASVAAIRGR